ncbi:endosome/lysosome-associated apoptosis and autophagy regulator 1 isoform 1-T2 [Synchiropus picturatus]
MDPKIFFLWLLLGPAAAELPLCKESDYHYEYTACDVLGSRWRVAVPNKENTCTGLPDPVRGTQCTFSCSEGEFLNMQTQKCQKCAAGTFSLGTGVAFDEWDSLPAGFVTHGVNTDGGNGHTNCSNSTWTPKGDYVASNTDECTATLSYAVSLKKPGTVSFQYFYPDSSIYFEFFIQNDQCQSTDSDSRWMSTTDDNWKTYKVQLNTGNNVLYWRTTSYSVLGNRIKPVLLKDVTISGVAFTSECFRCKPGTHSAKEGSSRCAPCPADTFSTRGATVCHQCDQDKYAESGSGSCKQRPPCTTSDYFYTHTPCDSRGQTQLMYKWNEPKICSETVKKAVKLPASGEKQTCPPCNPGFSFTNSSTCEPCRDSFFSNGTVCRKCPVGTEPVVGFEYKWWNTMPSNMKSSILRYEFSDVDHGTAWEVAGEYIYTTAGDRDSDRFLLKLSVPGYRDKDEYSQISFVFKTTCSADCSFSFLAGFSQWNNALVEQWKGTVRKQSYSYVIPNNNTVTFMWSFKRTEEFSTSLWCRSAPQVRKYSADSAKIFSISITNVIGGVATDCRRCALGSGSFCVPCPPGQYMASETGVCRSCPPNSIVRAEQLVGKSACVSCGPSTTSNQDHTACQSDCILDVLAQDRTPLRYDFSPLAKATGFRSSPRFTSKGLRYFHHFNVALCGTKDRALATCVNNVTEAKREVKGYVCQSTVVPSDIRSQSMVSSQPVVIGDSLVGVTTDTSLEGISSPHWLFPSAPGLPDVIFYYRSSEATLACQQGRSTTVRLRCEPTMAATDHLQLPHNCSEGTCDGCTFHFLWLSQHACPLCTKEHYREIVSACVQGIQKTTYVWHQPQQCHGGVALPAQTISTCVTLDFWLKFGVITGTIAAVLLITVICYFWKKTRKLQYKYSKLMMDAGGKECELPTADSCAIMEGEDAEDDLVDLTKKTFFTKIRTFSRERTSDGFDSVPLKTSHQHLDLEDSEDDI